MADVPSEAEALAPQRSHRIIYFQGHFEGFRYWLEILGVHDAEAASELLAEGYREQAQEALWLAESTLSSQVEVLPPDEAE